LGNNGLGSECVGYVGIGIVRGEYFGDEGIRRNVPDAFVEAET